MIPDSTPTGWLVLGFFGQGLFSCRFFVQWIASERRRASVVPPLFWWLSLGGALCLATYAALRRDPVIFVGQAAGLVVYLRNLALLRRGRLVEPPRTGV